ncbi:unnamed protein product [Cylicostephanus goldi]|uniref:DUF4371 domain-containing protein n=1 Tax=Cylicostephanus goldi TaxID=71465 RepID=A0A3P6QI87_CYLGO|nr:unnamed protein product [Cylicostephanus goldi]
MQHTRDGFVKMTDYISKTMKAKLIQYIKTNQAPFSLLIDSSTDPGSKQVLLVFIRFPDRYSLHPTTHFLEALEMTESETGRNIFEKIYEYFKREDLLHELTWNLVAVATDGAANMNAPGRGLRGILNANVSRSVKTIC